jgi:hypothetical protein
VKNIAIANQFIRATVSFEETVSVSISGGRTTYEAVPVLVEGNTD